jgi:hypothetical protein
MKRIVTGVALLAVLAVAGPASAAQKAGYYNGKTDDGNSMRMTLKGKRLSAIDGYVTTTCVPAHGVPTTRPGQFNPPGSFKLGTTRKVSVTRHVDWWGDTTFNYTISVKKLKPRIWVAKLSVNYGYVQYLLPGGGQVDQIANVCQGNDKFTFKV